jgi:hypothetical protein
VLQVEGPGTVKWFRHQAGWASGVCSQKKWVTEGAQEGKRRESTAQDEGGTVGVLTAPKAARRQDRRLAGDGFPGNDFTGGKNFTGLCKPDVACRERRGGIAKDQNTPCHAAVDKSLPAFHLCTGKLELSLHKSRSFGLFGVRL